MAKQLARITTEMIRRHFGPDAIIREKFFGGFRVTTPTGGDVEIEQERFEIHAGGDDVYEAMTWLAGEAWGGMSVFGTTEHIVAMLAHGGATGVNVNPKVEVGGGCAALFVAALVSAVVLGIAAAAGSGPGGCLLAAVIGGWIWRLMRKSQQREAQRRAQAFRYLFPRTHGGPRQASRTDASRQGWI